MFFSKYLSKMLLIGGVGTSAALLYALFPAWAIENIGQLPHLESHHIFYQHWGVMVGLLGLMMIAAAYKPQWRGNIMLYMVLEKAFMVGLLIVNWGSPAVAGFYTGAVMDALIVIWSIGYWFEQGSVFPVQDKKTAAVKG